MKTMKKNFITIYCDNADKNKLSKKIVQSVFKKLNLNLSHQALRRKMAW